MTNGLVELGADEGEGESESKVINQIFGRLLHPKNEVRYLENFFSDLRSVFFTYKGVFFTKVTKANIINHSIYQNVNFVHKSPFSFFSFTPP